MLPRLPAGKPQSLRGLYRPATGREYAGISDVTPPQLPPAPGSGEDLERLAGFADDQALDEPSLDIVIVSYQSRELLRDCLTSLSVHAPRIPARVFVVDNGSTDGTIEMVRGDFPEVELEASGENAGFSKANNLAIKRGRGRYVLALNPDTRLIDNGLDRLVMLMEKRPDIGMCGCRLELEDGTFDHAAKRAFPTPLGALAHFMGISRRRGAPASLAQYRAPDVGSGPIEAINGAFMLIRRSALDEVGLFDEGYWMYMEDLDLCYRFKQAGWLTWYEPSVTVVHVKAGTSGKTRALRLNYAFHYGMYRFYRKHYARQSAHALNILVYAGIVGKLASSILRNYVRRSLSAS
jgi:N-acetylglucosaminyl-diphospho-decaprenol L-rhamnosyltransferase